MAPTKATSPAWSTAEAGPGDQLCGQGPAGLDQAAVGDPADAVHQTSATSAGEQQ